MSDTSKRSASSPPAPAPAAGPTGTGLPFVQWKNLALIGAGILVLWGLVIASGSRAAMIVMGVLTGVLAGGGVYVYRWVKRQQSLAGLLQKAQASPEGRKAVLEQLSAGGEVDKDVMNLVVRAQLEAQEDPDKALATLDRIDMKKVPALMEDDVKGLRAQLLLLLGQTREAGLLADGIQVSRAQQAESRGMLAATVAEAWARSGKSKEASDLLSTFAPDDASYAKVRVPLMFARIFVNFAESRKELVRKDMLALVKDDPNYLGRFVHPKFKVHPELQKMAREVLMRDPNVRKMAQQTSRNSAPHRPRR